MANAQPTITKNQNDLAVLAQNLRRTSLGVRFGRLLFSPGNRGLTPKMITATFKELGMQIPEGVEIGLEVAQLASSGSALSDALQTYESFDDARSVVTNTGSTVQAALVVGDRLGWWDSNNQQAQMLRMGTNVALIVASGGLDVKSWVALALDIASISAGAQARASQIANGAVADYMKGLLTPQAKRAAELVQEFQESATKGPNEKRLTTFGFIAQLAAESPDLWQQIFPQFADWGLSYDRAYIVHSEVTTFYGDTQTSHAEHYWRSVAGYSKEQLREKVFLKLAYPILFPFKAADWAYQNQGKASLFQLAVLSMLTGLETVDPDRDMSVYLDQAFLTPSDFGENILSSYIANRTDPNMGLKKSSAIRIDGKSVVDAKENRSIVFDNKQVLLNAENAGRIDIVRRVPELNNVLREKYTYPLISPQDAWGAWNETVRVASRGGGTIESGVGGGIAKWRTIRNYFSALTILDQLRHDTYFGDWWTVTGQSNSDVAKTFEFMRDVDVFDATYRELQLRSMIRSINTLALGNVAYFLGTDPKKLIKQTPRDGGPVAYTTKG